MKMKLLLMMVTMAESQHLSELDLPEILGALQPFLFGVFFFPVLLLLLLLLSFDYVWHVWQ